MSADGFLVVDKPAGRTSHDVVVAVRKGTGIKRAGHAGTLDPMATGVVVVAVGRATRLVRFVQELPKTYRAVARLGVATDTLDADGSVTWREPMEVDQAEVEAVLPRFTGSILQVPPMVSALKVEGRRLYALARQGMEVERQPRPVEVHRLEVLDFAPGPYPEVTLEVVCGKGTYVRSLADDIARALGGRAHLVALRRLAIGGLTAHDHGVTLDELPTRWRDRLLPPADALSHLPAVEVDEGTATGVRNGVVFARSPAPGLPTGAHFRVLCPETGLLAVYRSEGAGAVPEVVLG